MKQVQIRVAHVPTDTVVFNGQPRHYWQAESGSYYAILADDLPNPSPLPEKPLSKGLKLEKLMDCSDRLDERYNRYYADYQAEPDTPRKKELWAKCLAVWQAEQRISKKIAKLLQSQEQL